MSGRWLSVKEIAEYLEDQQGHGLCVDREKEHASPQGREVLEV